METGRFDTNSSSEIAQTISFNSSIVPLERGIFSRLEVDERAGISLVEVHKRLGKSVIWVCERAQKGKQMNFMAL